ncbi:MAG: peptidoglycan/LPS O-acetylase OafA/YrhL [Halioglobus sp.]|jgi:peptidoglycan/LPS O-acetylase OafA/YrhL
MTATSVQQPKSFAPASHFLPAIEGMRGLAVLAVVLYHLKIPFFTAGYLGVDLFFVISGFIITRNILAHLSVGQFSLKHFYYRRYRRLFPALVATILVSLLGAAALMPPQALLEAGQSAAYALLSLANIHFWWEWNYFDIGADTKLLLHTWSLGVEEQFYLLWPVLILLAYKRNWGWQLTMALGVASLGLCAAFYDTRPVALFYLLPFRIHQLMAGALVAVCVFQFRPRLGGIATLFATLGLMGLFVTQPMDFSALNAVAVSMFGCFLLAGHSSEVSLRLYGNTIMQWLGRRSYALYLVHWPILVLCQYHYNFQLTTSRKIIIFVVSLVAAIALHHWVEQPFRSIMGKDGLFNSPGNRFVLGASALVMTLLLTFWGTSGLEYRVSPEIAELVNTSEAAHQSRVKAIRTGVCNLHPQHELSVYNEALCANVAAEGKSILIIGDSAAADSYLLLRAAFPSIEFSQATAAACPALLEQESKRTPKCRAFNDYRFSQLALKELDLIILSSVWRDSQLPALIKTVNYLKSHNKRVLVMGPSVMFPRSVPVLIATQLSIDEANKNLGRLADQKNELLQQMRRQLNMTSRLLPNAEVEVIDIAAVQCSPRCSVSDGGRLLYLDGFHLTPAGAEVFGKRLAEVLDLSAY